MIDTIVLNVNNEINIRPFLEINGLVKINKKSIIENNYDLALNKSLNFFILCNKKNKKMISYCLNKKEINFINELSELKEKKDIENILFLDDNILLKESFFNNVNLNEILLFKEENIIKKNIFSFNKEHEDLSLEIEKLYKSLNDKKNEIKNFSKIGTEIKSINDVILIDDNFTINNASLMYTPGPLNIRESVKSIITSHATHHRSEIAPHFYKNLAENIKYIFGSKKGFPIAMLSTGLGCIESCFANLTNPNDKALILSNGFFGNNLINNAKNYGLDIKTIEIEFGKAFDLDEIEKQIKGVKFLFMTHLETSAGVLNDVESISKICKEHNVYLIVDAVSSLVNEYFYFDKWGVDAAVGTSTKGLEICPGLSILCLSQRALELSNSINADRKRLIFLNWLTFQKKHLYNGMSPSTFPMGVIAAFNAATEEIKENGGIEAQHKFKKNISKDIYKELSANGYEIFPQKNYYSSWLIVVKTPEDISAKKLRAFLFTSFDILIETGIEDKTDRIIRIGIPVGMSKKEISDLKKLMIDFVKLERI